MLRKTQHFLAIGVAATATLAVASTVILAHYYFNDDVNCKPNSGNLENVSEIVTVPTTASVTETERPQEVSTTTTTTAMPPALQIDMSTTTATAPWTLLSETRKSKLTHFFENFLVPEGTDSSDGIEKETFQLHYEKLCPEFSQSQENPSTSTTTSSRLSVECILMQHRFSNLWDLLSIHSESRKNQEVITLEDFLNIWSQSGQSSLTSTESSSSASRETEMDKKCMEQFTEILFEIMGKSGGADGDLSEQKYMDFCSHHGYPWEDALVAFRDISADSGSHISTDLFEKLAGEYFYSDDETAQGNSLFCKRLFN